ncbi:MAG: beta strand repeat-containing protein [Candidatus Spyradosoma sp.]
MKTKKILITSLLAAAAMSATAFAEIDSEYGTLEWTTAPSRAGNFWSADYGLTFNFTNELIKTLDADTSYVVAAYWGNGSAGSPNANAVVLNYSASSDAWTLQIGRGTLSSYTGTIDGDSTFNFSTSSIFSQTITADTTYTLSVTGATGAMTPTLSWGDDGTETLSSYNGNMNGDVTTMNSALLTLYYSQDCVWGGGATGNWTDASWTIGESTNQTLGNLSNVTFNSSADMTATDAVSLNAITVADGSTLTLSGSGTVSSGSLATTGSIVISDGSTLAVTEVSGNQNDCRDFSNVSGAGTLSVALNTVNGQGVSASALTGVLYVSGTGRLQLDQTTLGSGASVKFADGADMVLNAAMSSFSHDLTLEGTSELYFNSNSSATVEFSGSVSGGNLVIASNGNVRTLNLSGAVSLEGLTVSDKKTVTFTGTGATVGTVTLGGTGTLGGSATITDLNFADATFSGFSSGSNIAFTNVKAASGTSSVSTTLDISGSLFVGGATLNLNNGANVTASQVRIAEQGSSTLNINTGATLTVTGSNNDHTTSASLLLSHWGYASTLALLGGNLNAENAVMAMGWSGQGTFSAQSGTARLSGLNFWAQESNFRGHFVLGSADSGDAVVYLGSAGIKDAGMTTSSSTESSITLGNGTLGATDSWSTAYNSVYTPITIQLVGTAGGTVFDTQDPDDSTAHTITINNAMAGDGKIVKRGAGTLMLNGNNTFTGGTTIEAGTVVAGHANALGTTTGVEVQSGATLNLGTDAVTVAGLSGEGSVGLADGTASSTLTVNSATDSIFSGSIGNAVSLVKQGDGTLELSGQNFLYSATDLTYQAVSVDGGTLRIVTNSQAATYAGATTVASGAALEVSVSDSVSVSLTSVSISEGGKLIIDLSDYASETETFALDIITASALSYNGVAFAENCTSLLGNAVELKGWTQEGWTELLAYDGSKLSLTMTIPEPSLFGLLAGLGALALAGSRRRRRKA